MLDKALSDDAVEISSMFNGCRVTVYRFYSSNSNHPDGHSRDVFCLEPDHLGINVAVDEVHANLGDPIAWGFSHR